MPPMTPDEFKAAMAKLGMTKGEFTEALGVTYTVYANVEQQETSKVSTHKTLAAAGRAYQAAHTGNLRRVLDSTGQDVTAAACDAANQT